MSQIEDREQELDRILKAALRAVEAVIWEGNDLSVPECRLVRLRVINQLLSSVTMESQQASLRDQLFQQPPRTEG